MSHSVSAAKRNRQSQNRHIYNRSIKREIITLTKRFQETVESGNKEAATEQLRTCVSKLDKALKKGVLHQNTVARRKSSLWRALNKAAAPKAS